MKIRYFSLLVFTLLKAQMAGSKEVMYEYKEWKTLQNTNGYEIKYPACWAPMFEGDIDIEVSTDVKHAKDVALVEGPECARPQFRQNVSGNSLGLSALKDFYKSKEEFDKEVNRNKERIFARRKRLVTGEATLYTKDYEEYGNYKYIDVENLGTSEKPSFRWHLYAYCFPHYYELIGPNIYKSDPVLFKKFQADDVGLPEPERTIYESFKCVDPKEVEQKLKEEAEAAASAKKKAAAKTAPAKVVPTASDRKKTTKQNSRK